MILSQTSKIFLISLISLNLICPPIFADDDKAVVLFEKEPAPFTGLLFKKDKAQELKNTVLERDALKSINESLNTSLSLKDSNLTQISTKNDLLMKENDSLATNLNRERTANMWVYFFYFALGVAGTSAAMYGLKNLNK